MKSKVVKYFLRLLTKKKKQSIAIKALDFLFLKNSLEFLNNKTIQLVVVDIGFNICLHYNGDGFKIIEKEPEIVIFLHYSDIICFSSIAQVNHGLASRKIEVQANDVDKKAVIKLIESINPIKVNQCARYLRTMLGLKSQRIEDKLLPDLTIRDIASDADVNYVRDQAIAIEKHDPALAFKLMHLAHAVRPKGPFIKRKLEEYRSKGFHRIRQTHCSSLSVIPVVEGKLGYFPVPKSACSSLKTAFYEFRHQREFNSNNHRGLHVHDYWLKNMSAIDQFENVMIVVRDPIERFLSAYASRVLDHGELGKKAVENQSVWLAKAIPHFTPNLSQFIKYLDVYLQVPSIGHHCQPLCEWVNYDMSQFSDVIPLRDIEKVEILVSKHTGAAFTVPHHHVGKNKVHLGKLTREELDTLLEFYAADYDLLAPWYSKQAIINKWQHSIESF